MTATTASMQKRLPALPALSLCPRATLQCLGQCFGGGKGRDEIPARHAAARRIRQGGSR